MEERDRFSSVSLTELGQRMAESLCMAEERCYGPVEDQLPLTSYGVMRMDPEEDDLDPSPDDRDG